MTSNYYESVAMGTTPTRALKTILIVDISYEAVITAMGLKTLVVWFEEIILHIIK